MEQKKTMEGLWQILNNQVRAAIRQRFKIKNVTQEQIEKMLRGCYQAEVLKRGGQFEENKDLSIRLTQAAKWMTGDYKPGLLIYGADCGTGKTTMANAISNLINYLEDTPIGYDRKIVYKVNAIQLVKTYSENYELYKRFTNQELLFIDDLGTEPASIKLFGNEYSPLTELLYTRYDRLSFTILTSNLSDEQIRERYGVRIDDRLKEMFERVHYSGNSYRK